MIFLKRLTVYYTVQCLKSCIHGEKKKHVDQQIQKQSNESFYSSNKA